MERNTHYNTKQKEIIYNYIKQQKNQFTIKEIYNYLNKKVGLTTIYRLVDELDKLGYLNKEIGDNNVTYYQYLEKCIEKNHFYLKCDKCGEMIHIDCDCINELSNHILKKHKFTPNKDHIIINGICNNCLSKTR